MSKPSKGQAAASNTLPEYDFTHGVRGKHYRAYQRGHIVKIRKSDGTTVVQHFKLEEGAVVIAPDVREYFPDSDTVNQTLRTLIGLIPRKRGGANAKWVFALAGQEKFREAEPLLVEGYFGMKEREAKIPPAAKTRLPEAIRRLVDLHTAWDRPDEAEKWRAKLEETQPGENKWWLSLGRFYSTPPIARDELLARIRVDATVSEPVRQRALEFARQWP